MRYLAILLLAGLFMAGCGSFKGPIGGDSPEHLLALFTRYHERGDIDNMMRLFLIDEVPNDIVQLQKRKLNTIYQRELVTTTVEELSGEAQQFFNRKIEVSGQIIQFNLYVIGQLTVDLAGNRVEAFLYGKKEDRYYFALQTRTVLQNNS